MWTGPLQLALSLDIPFWPQLPRVSYYEDMYVQASEHFPGIVLDLEKRTLRFSLDKFVAEYEEAMSHFGRAGILGCERNLFGRLPPLLESWICPAGRPSGGNWRVRSVSG